MIRHRCSGCQKVITTPLMESRHAKMYRHLEREDLASQLYHERFVVIGGGRGLIGCRTEMRECGPVLEEEVDDYILCLEYFLGE